MRRLKLIVLAFILLAAGRPLLAVEGAPWFNLSPGESAHWRVSLLNAGGLAGVQVTADRPPPGARIRRVGVLYTQASSAYDTAIDKILSSFREKGLAVELVALNYRGDAAAAQQAWDYLQQKQGELVFVMGSEATAYAARHLRRGKIPVVSVCAKDPVLLGQIGSYAGAEGGNMAFTSLNMTIAGQFAYLADLRPGLRNLGILVDATNKGAVLTQARPLAAAARQNRVQAVEVAVTPGPAIVDELAGQMAAALRQMRQRDPELRASLWIVTGSTAVFREIAAINRHAGGLPVVSMVPEIVQEGGDSADVSIGVSFESNARLAAKYAIDILAGRTGAGAMKVGIVSPPDIAINFRRTRASGLKVPFSFFEAASDIFDYDGVPVRRRGAVTARLTPDQAREAAR